MPLLPIRAVLAASITAALALCASELAWGDAGPPYLTNDPGTPGAGNWEINVATMQTLVHGSAAYQLPQLDVNFGLGERVQLTYQAAYVLESRTGAALSSGWTNAYPGVKWRFYDQGEGGWQLSTFPQFETAGARSAQQRGIAEPGSRLLLPFEAARTAGTFTVDFEAGYYVQGPPERILGLVIGRPVTSRLELEAELYNDHVLGTRPDALTLDVGGRYRIASAFILLFMAGRSVDGAAGQPQFMGYLGLQILLSHYGLKLGGEP